MIQTIENHSGRFSALAAKGVCPDCKVHTPTIMSGHDCPEVAMYYTKRICSACNLTVELGINGDIQDVILSREVPVGRLLAIRVVTNTELVTASYEAYRKRCKKNII